MYMVAVGNLKDFTDHAKSLLTFTRVYYLQKNNLKNLNVKNCFRRNAKIVCTIETKTNLTEHFIKNN